MEQKPSIASEFKIAVPVAAVFIAFFIALEKLGIVNMVNTSSVGYGTAFVVGFIASVSTCMAVIGGLVLSVSANFAKSGDALRPQAFFHIGRLVSFFILGGAMGAIGSVFQLGATGSFILSIVVASILLILGLNLLDIFPWAERLRPRLPDFVASRVQGLDRINHTFTPLLIGAATFFLPCGFTQSMQIYALGTGDPWKGAITMFVFALGTLPMLAALSFGSAAFRDKARSGAFFKAAGLVVIFFGLFNLANSLAAAGVAPSLFSSSQAPSAVQEAQMSLDSQVVEISAKGGYYPGVISARAGVPLTIQVKTSGTFDCSTALAIPAIGYRKVLPASGVTEIQVPPQPAGSTLQGICQMGMYDFAISFK